MKRVALIMIGFMLLGSLGRADDATSADASTGRCWALIWGTLNDFPIPDRLPPDAETVLRALRFDRAAGRNPPEHWFSTLLDAPRDGPIRDEIRQLTKESLPAWNGVFCWR